MRGREPDSGRREGASRAVAASGMLLRLALTPTRLQSTTHSSPLSSICPLQSVMLVELDGARKRTVGVQVVGTRQAGGGGSS